MDNRSEIIDRVFELHAEGLGPSAIARQLESEQVKTFTGKSKWQPGTVSNILRGRHGTGQQQANKQRQQPTTSNQDSELKRLKAELESVRSERDQLKAELAKYERPTADLKIGKWNVQKQGDYYKAFRKWNGKTVAVYIGKRYDDQEAAEKIMARYPDIGID
jgi:hypothetical protein